MRFFFSRIFPLVFLVTGAVIAFFGIRGLVRANASVGWPSTEGRIVESSVGSKTSSGSNRSGITYHAEILYEFTVDGTLFQGNRVAYGDYGSSNISHARSIVNHYPEGKEITVHYMPGNPEESLLEPGVQAQAWLMPAFGLIFFVAGSLVWILVPRMLRNVDEP